MYIGNFRSNKENKDDDESYPDFFIRWDNAIEKHKKPGYYEEDDLREIIDIYLSEDESEKARFTIDYALKLYPDSTDMIYEILLMLNEYSCWNELLTLSEKYKDVSIAWPEGHRLSALLHLGMEEDAFNFFKNVKIKYADDSESLVSFYHAMAESLFEIDLYEAAINVINEATPLFGDDEYMIWILIRSYMMNKDKKNVLEIAKKIQMLYPLDSKSWYELGEVYVNVDEIEKGIEAFEFALSLGLKSSELYLALIYAYDKNGNLNKVMEKADEYLKINPNNHLTNLLAANSCAKKEDWPNAMKYIQTSIDLRPELESLYIHKAEFLLQMGEFKKAMNALEDGIARTGDARGVLQSQLKKLHDLFDGQI